MKQNDIKKPFEEYLMAYITKDNSLFTQSLHKETELIFNKEYPAFLSNKKADDLLSLLNEALSKESLGKLIENRLSSNPGLSDELFSKTGLTTSLFDSIKADMIFSNSIPIKSLVKLMKYLGISLEAAQHAMEVTFNKLLIESKLFSNTPTQVQPAFRNGVKFGEISSIHSNLKPDESYLYQNMEALNKYLKRFAELFNES